VIELGDGVTGYAVGDRVASNGKHAEVVCVPLNLCAKIPESVSDEAGAFTVIGAIALQGIRLVQPTLGEAVVVTGLGLIGLMTVQLLRAHGCRVLGLDFDPAKVALARALGAETVDLSSGQDPLVAAAGFSRGIGVDAVVITASSKSNEPVHQAAQMCRKRGRIVLVGVVGLELSRADFYEKELSFQVSCSYGPGRYDPSYEEGGQDYPVGFVRWTEQRNFEAVIDMLADRRLDVHSLISHRFPLERAEEAYRLVGGGGPSMAILLQYPDEGRKPDSELRLRTVNLVTPGAARARASGAPVVGFVGAGNYATQVLIPAFKSAGGMLKGVASAGGITGAHAGKKFGMALTTTDSKALIQDPEIDTIVITTRHDSHARYVCEALKMGKHVFVEKPLALRAEELSEIEAAVCGAPTGTVLMVGFNRRFAPQVRKMKVLLETVPEPKCITMTVNAGMIPPDHWTQDAKLGGGRIIGEGCHFIDLLRFLVGVPINAAQVMSLGGASVSTREDKVTFTLSFADGSIGTVHYWANGSKSVPKERVEVFCAGRVLQLNNFRSLDGYGWPGFSKFNLWRQDKGNNACAAAFLRSISASEQPPIPIDQLLEVTRVSFEIAAAAR
jgi:predicted dehydrogenase/threonine dehydrogenase-like Zn-dependent dehydrogenase